MTRFRYIGDPRHDGDGPEIFEMFGYTFVKGGVGVVVEGEAARKLAANNHFEAVKRGRKPKAQTDGDTD